MVSLAASPDIGYRFVNWTGDVGTISDINAASTSITVNGDYTINANFEEDQVVTFADPNLEAAVREAIGVVEGPIYALDVEGLTSLNAVGRGISSLGGLDYAIGLSELHLQENRIRDIWPIGSLTGLTELALHSNQIVDVSPLADLTKLRALNIGGNRLSDISPLAQLTEMTWLDISGNQITDILPLAGLTNLGDLYLYENQINDISPLVENEGLADGDYVGLRWNPLSTASRNTYIPELEARGVSVSY